MGSGPNGCFTPRTYQHVNLGVAGIVLYPIALLWSFVGTQYIADEYFRPPFYRVKRRRGRS